MSWDGALGFLLDGKKGASLNVIVSVVFHHIFDSLSDLGRL